MQHLCAHVQGIERGLLAAKLAVQRVDVDDYAFGVEPPLKLGQGNIPNGLVRGHSGVKALARRGHQILPIALG